MMDIRKETDKWLFEQRGMETMLLTQSERTCIEIAFKAGYELATKASEPVGEIRCDASTGHVYGVFWYGRCSLPIGTKVYTIPQDQSARTAELAKDAARYKFLRNRLQIQMQQVMNGEYKTGLIVRTGNVFLEYPGRSRQRYYDKSKFDEEMVQLDEAIDKALENQDD